MKIRDFKRTHTIPTTLGRAWRFLSNPRNLAAITPPSLGFEVVTDPLPEEIHAGLIITYRVRPLAGIPLTWITEITHLEKPNFFVDEQRFGPYAFWHHQHHLKAVPGGIEMTDLVHYKVPGGPLGDLLVPWLILPRLQGIFTYRERKLTERFASEDILPP